jgi:hypothetical protein
LRGQPGCAPIVDLLVNLAHGAEATTAPGRPRSLPVASRRVAEPDARGSRRLVSGSRGP